MFNRRDGWFVNVYLSIGVKAVHGLSLTVQRVQNLFPPSQYYSCSRARDEEGGRAYVCDCDGISIGIFAARDGFVDDLQADVSQGSRY